MQIYITGDFGKVHMVDGETIDVVGVEDRTATLPLWGRPNASSPPPTQYGRVWALL